MLRLKALLPILLLFTTVFSLPATSDSCSPVAAVQSLPNGLWKFIEIENLQPKEQKNPESYANWVIRLYNNLADHMVVPHCQDCNTQAKKYTETLIKELSRNNEWKSYWLEQSPADRLMDILLPVLTRVSHSRNSSYHEFLVNHIDKLIASNPESASCQHLKGLSQTESSEPLIGLKGGFTIAVASAVLVLCLHF